MKTINDFSPGDVLLFHNKGFLPKAIRFFMKIYNKKKKLPETSNEAQKNKFGISNVSHYGLTEIEYTERERLLELQRSNTRWFSQEEFNRLKELSYKMYKNAGSPHCS